MKFLIVRIVPIYIIEMSHCTFENGEPTIVRNI